MLFGGATGDTGKYIITGDTYALDLISYKWTKLEGSYFSLDSCNVLGSGIAPSPRAAHGSCSVDQLQMVIYGGATGGIFSHVSNVNFIGGSLASDDLYLLDLRNGD